MYQKINSFCLPFPGNTISSSNPSDKIRDIDPFFLKMVSVFVEEVIDSLSPLMVHNKEITCEFFKEFLFAFSSYE